MRRTDSCYRVKIRHGAIYRFEMRRVCFIYLDGIVYDIAKSIFQLQEERVLIARVAHWQAETFCLNSFIIYNGVLSVAPCRKNG